MIKKSELEKRLKDAGCILSRHGKRHDKWMNPTTGAAEYVPRHASEVATGTAQKILKRLVGK
ncbi:type II toxin-antitoxin system HicA family toxin [Prevotella melaninogenica]